VVKETSHESEVLGEVFGYIVDRTLGLGRVPPTFVISESAEGENIRFRTFQLFIPDTKALIEARAHFTSAMNSGELSDCALLDAILDNPDRHSGNVIYKRENVEERDRWYYIDHGISDMKTPVAEAIRRLTPKDIKNLGELFPDAVERLYSVAEGSALEEAQDFWGSQVFVGGPPGDFNEAYESIVQRIRAAAAKVMRSKAGEAGEADEER